MQAKKSSLSTLSNEALCKLRDEIAAMLNSRANDLQRQLNQLTGGAVAQNGELSSQHIHPKRNVKKLHQNIEGQMAAHGRGAGSSPDG